MWADPLADPRAVEDGIASEAPATPARMFAGSMGGFIRHRSYMGTLRLICESSRRACAGAATMRSRGYGCPSARSAERRAGSARRRQPVKCSDFARLRKRRAIVAIRRYGAVMTDKAVELDAHRGMAAQRETELRRSLHEVQADQGCFESDNRNSRRFC